MLEKCSKCVAYEKCKKIQVDFNLSDRDLELLDVLGAEIAPAGAMVEDSMYACWEIIKRYTQDEFERLKMIFFIMGIEYTFQRLMFEKKVEGDIAYG